MCDRTKDALETVREAIIDQKWRIADVRDEKGLAELNYRQARDKARAYRRDAATMRERLREEKATMKALRAELLELKPVKPRKAKGFPVREYFGEPSPQGELVAADFTRYANGFNVYD